MTSGPGGHLADQWGGDGAGGGLTDDGGWTALTRQAAAIGARLIAQRQTICVAESSTGGLIAAALLASPGASRFFVGGAIVYTARARAALLQIDRLDVEGMRSATAPYADLVAERARRHLRTDWALAETGAAGPTGNPYGDAAGHCCISLRGPAPMATVIETGRTDRTANMVLFAAAALRLLDQGLARSAKAGA